MFDDAHLTADPSWEEAVLNQAISHMTGWISMLPESSVWRHGFVAARRELVEHVQQFPAPIGQTPRGHPPL